MKRFIQYAAPAFVVMLGALAATSCKGRHMDATPNGETVEVNIQPCDTATVSETPAALAQPESENNI